MTSTRVVIVAFAGICIGLVGWLCVQSATSRPVVQAPAESIRYPRASAAVPAKAGTGAGTVDRHALQADAFDAHWRELLRDGDPRQRLLALRMLHTVGHDLAAMRAAHREAMRIAAAAPDDPLTALMQTWFCQPLPEGCTDAVRSAWAEVEPDNVAARMVGLSAVLDDPSAFDAVLADAARGERYDSHHVTLAREAVVLFDDVPLPPISSEERGWLDEMRLPHTDASRRLVMATAMTAAVPMMELRGITRGCRPPVSSTRARGCRAVLGQMAHASTMLERFAAYGMLEQLLRGTPEGAHWAAEQRRLRWWAHQLSVHRAGADFMRDVLRFGEVEAMRRQMLRTGMPLDPPSGWNAGGM